MSTGKTIQIIGAVVDVEFPREAIPRMYDALLLEETGLTLEVQQQLGDGVVRTIAMGASEGLKRGMSVKNTGKPIQVPVGEATLGRIMDVLGEPIDEKGPIPTEMRWPIHRPRPAMKTRPPSVEILETGIKVIDLIMPIAKGGKIGSVRRRRRGQDRDADGADSQHRDRALAVTRCLRAWASVLAKVTTSTTR